LQVFTDLLVLFYYETEIMAYIDQLFSFTLFSIIDSNMTLFTAALAISFVPLLCQDYIYYFLKFFFKKL